MGLYRVSIRGDAWQAPSGAEELDPELYEFARRYIVAIPPPGGLTPDDWSVPTVYCATDVFGALVQAFARYRRSSTQSDPESPAVYLSERFVRSFTLHSCQFKGSFLWYDHLQVEHPELPEDFQPGQRSGHVVAELEGEVDALRYRSSHGPPHTTVVLIGDELEFADVTQTQLAPPSQQVTEAFESLGLRVGEAAP